MDSGETTPNRSRPCGSNISVDASRPIPFDLAPCQCGAVTNYYTSLFIFTVLHRVSTMGELSLKSSADKTLESFYGFAISILLTRGMNTCLVADRREPKLQVCLTGHTLQKYNMVQHFFSSSFQ